MQDSKPDEELLIDFVLGRCDQAAAEGVRRRLGQDRDFAALHENIAASFRALGKYDVDEPPANLVERTMARVRATRRSEALVAAEPLRRRIPFPAFSMRELAALAAAAVLVVGIIIPSLRHARRRAQRSLCSANLGQIGTALNHYANENDDTLPGSPLAAGSWLPRPGQPRASNSAALFQLARLAFAETDVFQCPATPARPFAIVAGMTRFPSAEAISYSYQYALGGPIRRSDPQLARVAEQMAIGVDSTPLFRNGVFRPEKSALPRERKPPRRRAKRPVPARARQMGHPLPGRRQRQQHLPGRGNLQLHRQRSAHLQNRQLRPAQLALGASRPPPAKPGVYKRPGVA